MFSSTTLLGLAATLLGLVAGIAGFALLLRFVLRRVARTSAERIARRFRPEEIIRQDLVANFFGLESRGVAQLRGNGGLVLTANELWFTRAVAEESFEVPLRELVAVELVSSHLGKRVGRPLLKVRFRTPAGEDSIAWSLLDPAGWQAELLRLAPPAA